MHGGSRGGGGVRGVAPPPPVESHFVFFFCYSTLTQQSSQPPTAIHNPPLSVTPPPPKKTRSAPAHVFHLSGGVIFHVDILQCPTIELDMRGFLWETPNVKDVPDDLCSVVSVMFDL